MSVTFCCLLFLSTSLLFAGQGHEYQQIKQVISIRLQRLDFHLTSCVTHYTLGDPRTLTLTQTMSLEILQLRAKGYSE